MSFLGNCPVLFIFGVILVVYLLVAFLSSKRFIQNKGLRRVFKKVRKYRTKYGIINDGFWICYLYTVFVCLLQFKMGGFDST